jgi:serine phosphatase RsbU (regulator of sigma subunit)
LGKLSNIYAQQVCDELLDTMRNYENGSKQDDDVTLVAIQAVSKSSIKK